MLTPAAVTAARVSASIVSTPHQPHTLLLLAPALGYIRPPSEAGTASSHRTVCSRPATLPPRRLLPGFCTASSLAEYPAAAFRSSTPTFLLSSDRSHISAPTDRSPVSHPPSSYPCSLLLACPLACLLCDRRRTRGPVCAVPIGPLLRRHASTLRRSNSSVCAAMATAFTFVLPALLARSSTPAV